MSEAGVTRSRPPQPDERAAPLSAFLDWARQRQVKFSGNTSQAEAVGVVASMHEHYFEFGYFEGRLPCPVEVDAAFYVKEYPDVAVGILEQAVKSAQSHFEICGFKKGRLPRRGRPSAT